MTDDAFGDGRASKLTFLIYLNGSSGGDGNDVRDVDNMQFSGGHTTFFRAGNANAGGDERVIEARAVAPATGEMNRSLMCDA